ncbi:uroporphyrinogen-III synthase [Paenibacillus gallinarum]|uniref:Uroporphyrinogen-III synthase n=1 Tax=Paenibacillus gallinarum TaxID=2762232 RepID=A0ABR8SV90_9BACL|nr:uroporphyrinogen-III synthase [Paenibacillus gallinarum]MBD7967400.1 uroporphyrinogen-III synthase [Paenibacillus gallinarum]
MSKDLQNKKIVIAGSQKTEEMAEIIERRGGIPLVRSLQGLTDSDPVEVEEDVKRFTRQGADWFIFTTGIGFEAMIQAAERLNAVSEFEKRLKETKIACRGYKTNAYLKRSGIHPVVCDDDGTIASMIEKLEVFDFTDQKVWIQLHGELSSQLHHFIQSKGSMDVQVVLPYRYHAPEQETLASLMNELIQREVDAVCFTTRVQVGYLFDYAKEHGREEELKSVFEQDVLAAAVGKVTAEALQDKGVSRIIVPEKERMGALIVEIANYYEGQLNEVKAD